MEASLEELNNIEKRFRNYILILDFILRETRTELSENRAKREMWQEHHDSWKQNHGTVAPDSFQDPKITIEPSLIYREFRPLQPLTETNYGQIPSKALLINEFRPLL
ncbi:hypothetical protein CH367_03450 [Leptospira barantonii]|uniref:Uncharacterized protein n=1 Tax=Leptospira barantonii TaxID=2023184 RepID=A0ABX4NR15_9LEPT|nr:hypothetical protein CH367_03450 [Leptospira barantonii]